MNANVHAIGPVTPATVAPLASAAAIPPLTLSPQEAANAIGVHRTEIYRMLERGHLPALKSGRRTLIRYVDLQAYLATLPAFQPRRGEAVANG